MKRIVRAMFGNSETMRFAVVRHAVQHGETADQIAHDLVYQAERELMAFPRTKLDLLATAFDG